MRNETKKFELCPADKKLTACFISCVVVVSV